MNTRALGLNIKAERSRKELTQEKLAELIGMTQNSIYLIEKGKQIPNAINLYLIAKVLGIDINELYKGIE
ncbi:helix-turn-helix transcriptional regulator [bacterium]|nr:helix-turn-helix transcriptional regulator [bacterium]